MTVPFSGDSKTCLDFKLLDSTQRVAAYAKSRLQEPNFETQVKKTFSSILKSRWKLTQEEIKDWSECLLLALRSENLPNTFTFKEENAIKRWREIYFKSKDDPHGELTLNWGDKSTKVSSALLEHLLFFNEIPTLDQMFPAETMKITFSDGITVEMGGGEEEFLVRLSPVFKQICRGDYSETSNRNVRIETLSSVDYKTIFDHLLYPEKEVAVENALVYFAFADQYDLLSLENGSLSSIEDHLELSFEGLKDALTIKNSYHHTETTKLAGRHLQKYLSTLQNREEFDAVLLFIEEQNEVELLGSVTSLKLPPDADDTSLAKLNQFPNLDDLDLEDCNKISCDGIGFPQSILSMNWKSSRSQSVFVDRTHTFPAILSSISSSLIKLNLSGSEITEEQAQQLAKALLQSSIIDLDLSYNKLGDIRVGILASILPKAQISYLNLSGNAIGDSGIKTLAYYLADCMRLFHFNLSDNRLNDEGVEILIPGLEYSYISNLNLARNKISYSGIAKLAPLLNSMHDLFDLDLSYNELIGDQGTMMLASTFSQSSLQGLNLAKTNLGPIGVKALIAAIPKSNLSRINVAENPRLSAIDIKTLKDIQNKNGKKLEVQT